MTTVTYRDGILAADRVTDHKPTLSSVIDKPCPGRHTGQFKV